MPRKTGIIFAFILIVTAIEALSLKVTGFQYKQGQKGTSELDICSSKNHVIGLSYEG